VAVFTAITRQRIPSYLRAVIRISYVSELNFSPQTETVESLLIAFLPARGLPMNCLMTMPMAWRI
jgi:hypothetical protein